MLSSKKIVILGHFGVGKTSLIRRFVKDTFSDNYKVTIGVHITKKVVEIAADKKISLILWDLEGTDDVLSIRASYLLGTHGLVFVFDVSRPSTFEHLNADLEIVSDKAPDIPVLVVGNKSDLVDKAELNIVVDKNELPVDFLTSAKTGEFVNELFLKLATLLADDA